MPKIKRHLKDLYRTSAGRKTRNGMLRLDMNESVSGLPSNFVRSVIDEISPESLAVYPEYFRLQEMIATHNNLKTGNICLANGSDAAIKYLFDAYVSRGDKVLLTDPTFAMYPVYCRMFNASPVPVKYGADLEFPYSAFVDKISGGIKMAVIVNPNNPTGSVLGHDKIIEIIKKASRHDVLVIVDEAYFYFYPRTVIKEVRNFKNLVVLRTFSKLCGLAAARLGYAAADPEIIENLRRVRPTFDVNGLAVLFAEKLFGNPRIIHAAIKAANSGKKYLALRLSEAGIEYRVGHANFILINCGGAVKEIMRKLEKKNILVQGGFKQPSLKDYIRVTVGDVPAMERFWKSFIYIPAKRQETRQCSLKKL